ncbi:RNA-binding S4 [Polymorphum gilvum SL003B-26A1]|uniref:RNA-binding S4 n=1 Tax=Polymorphum gilvum (strain LMG 25793 / CGMCC 1.9160 / SL003B-26A1) TaxID=991905 RepID=F2J274_POLGS|nr:RNA-binding S4 [Polymorphum gilvum SL003B-26A1]
MAKSRTLAQKLALAGQVRLNREKIASASKAVRIGDVLTITLDRKVLVLKIAALGSRRGPAPEARALYEDLSPPPPDNPVPGDLPQGQREQGSGRPTKRERRQLDALRQQDGKNGY